MNNVYLIKTNNLLIFDRPKKWENFSYEDLKDYLSASHEILREKLDKYFQKGEALTVEEEKKLRFMFEALIDAKKLIQR